MNVLILNVVFGFIGFLIAVGCPVIGMIWQHREDRARLTLAPAPRIARREEVPASVQPQAA